MYAKQQIAFRWACLAVILLCGNIAVAQFSAIINVPPDPPPTAIAAGTQINVFEGGVLPDRFDLSDTNPGGEINFFGGSAGSNFRVNGSTVNLHDGLIGIQMDINSGSEVNITGGRISFFASANSGSIVNMSGGSIAFGANANAGSTFTVSGGMIGRAFSAHAGSMVTFAGGYVEGDLRADAGSNVTFLGGVIGDDFKASGSLTFHGDEFSIDGQPVSGLTDIGDQVQISLPLLSQFTGTLADGTPFSFSYLDDDDQLHNASITLVRTELTPTEALEIHLPDDPTPRGVRSGQTLFVGEGATVGDDFHAGDNSNVIVKGGTIGDNFEAAGATVDITGGEIGHGFGVFVGSEVNILGGRVGRSLRPLPGSVVNIAGGHVQSAFLLGGSEVLIRGGTMGDGFWARSNAAVRVMGSDFRLNGAELPGLENIGDTISIDLPSSYVFSGTLSDGTPFAFASNRHDRFEPGTLSLVRSETPAIEAGTINVPAGPAPRGIRAGQTVVVHEGGELGDSFNAGDGSTVIVASGAVGANLEAVGATVHLIDGQIGDRFDAFAGTTVIIEGGSVGQLFYAAAGSLVNVIAGRVGSGFIADGSTIVISGGEIDGFGALAGSQVTISGGTFNSFGAASGATVELIGTQFLLDGNTITGLENPGDSILLPNRNGEVLHVRLRDGSTHDFILRTGSRGMVGNFATDSILRLTVVVPEPGTALIGMIGALLLVSGRRHRSGDARQVRARDSVQLVDNR